MIAGHLPFEGETAMEMIGAILKDEPKSLDKTEVTPELEKIIGKCLRKDRNERYQTIKDVLIDVQDVKQDLEFQDKLERTVSPEKEEPKTQILHAATADGINQTITNQTAGNNTIKNYLATGLAILLVSTVGFFGYQYFTANHKQIESIAVMPFVNESGNADVEYLSDGMTETLISSLSQIPNLNVKARSSVFRYKGKETDAQTIGKELDVQAILNGRVTQRGDQLTLSLELIDAQTENVIWSERYNRKQADLVPLQSEIARDVSSKLKTKLSGADEQRLTKNYTENNEAYQLYLRGRFYSNRRTVKDIRKSIEYFQQAAMLDPNYTLAYTGLADAYSVLSTYGGAPSNEVVPKAREAALKALSLDDQLAESHISLGIILNYYDYDFAGAEREFKRAIELNPNSAMAHQSYAILLSNLGRHEEALNEIRRALEIEPLSLISNRSYGIVLFYARRYDESAEQLKKTLELDVNFVPAYDTLGNAYRLQGRYADSVEAYASSQEALNNFEAAALRRESFAKGGWHGFLRDMTDKPQLNNLKSSYIVATFHTELGEKDKALAALNRAYQEREFFITLLKVDPRLDPLRDDARFQELLRKIGFP